ncbi:hypothetical protein CCACVL1_18498 [Corchorus capsularis]|uniref:Uncharacterized protein n=1 Tax=Corchorus capsularis TaxID=210143 RepID=A0A1R3HKV9_COCAP|nr:hypothetical protein CCACVL1_18498 [Corchorus capsularis]
MAVEKMIHRQILHHLHLPETTVD